MPLPAQNPMAAVLAARVAQQAQAQPAKPPAQLVPMPQPQVKMAPVVHPSSQSGPTIQEIDQKFRAATQQYRFSIVEMAFYGRLLRAKDAWDEIGLRDEEHYRQHVGLSEKTWQDCMTLGERLQGVSLAEARELTIAAATQLTKVHPRIWSEYSWIEEAKLMPAREFKMLVEQRNHEAKPGKLAEPRATLAMQVAVSKHAEIERRLTTIRKQGNLRNSAEALESALNSAARERSVRSQLTQITEDATELARLSSTVTIESEIEAFERFTAGIAITHQELLALTNRQVRKILRSLEQLNAVLPETSEVGTEPAARTGNEAVR